MLSKTKETEFFLLGLRKPCFLDLDEKEEGMGAQDLDSTWVLKNLPGLKKKKKKCPAGLPISHSVE